MKQASVGKKQKADESISIQFFGDFLNINARSSEVSQEKNCIKITDEDIDSSSWEWQRRDIPKLFSPLNKIKLVKQRRLLVLI